VHIEDRLTFVRTLFGNFRLMAPDSVIKDQNLGCASELLVELLTLRIILFFDVVITDERGVRSVLEKLETSFIKNIKELLAPDVLDLHLYIVSDVVLVIHVIYILVCTRTIGRWKVIRS